MAIDITASPYYATSENDYYTKGYRALLGIPGRVLQAREFTDLGFFSRYLIKALADQVFKSSNIITTVTGSDLPKITYLCFTVNDWSKTTSIEEF